MGRNAKTEVEKIAWDIDILSYFAYTKGRKTGDILLVD